MQNFSQPYKIKKAITVSPFLCTQEENITPTKVNALFKVRRAFS
jgi:hypothetical protein